MSYQRTITICAYNRPDYLYEVLRSVIVALRECPQWCIPVPLILIALDPGGDRYIETKAVILRFIDTSRAWLKPQLIEWPQHLGVSESPRRLIQHVFIERRSEFNLHLEDDTVLSPDALRLAEWFRRESARPRECTSAHPLDKVIGLALSSRSTECRCAHKLTLRTDFGVWGWATNYAAWWLWLAHYWNEKLDEPLGWDYGFTRMMQRNGLVMLEPALSRVRNIGREGGVHETPEGWDREHMHAVVAGPDDMQRIEDFRLETPETEAHDAKG